MKNKILPTFLQGNYGDSLGEFSSMSYGVFGAEFLKKKKWSRLRMRRESVSLFVLVFTVFASAN